HYNGHFCKGQEPSVGVWTAQAWTSELDQFFGFLYTAAGQGLRVTGPMIKGGRTPCLEGNFDELLPVLAKRGMTYDGSQVSYDAAVNGNHAPLVVGNHFNDWAGGAFSTATEQFMGEVCGRTETVCATYSEVIEWLRLQDPAVLDGFRALPKVQVS